MKLECKSDWTIAEGLPLEAPRTREQLGARRQLKIVMMRLRDEETVGNDLHSFLGRHQFVISEFTQSAGFWPYMGT